MSPPLWRSSPRRHRPRRLRAAQPEPLGLGRGDAARLLDRWTGRANVPRSGRLAVARLLSRSSPASGGAPAGRYPASASASRSSSSCSRSARSLQVAGVNTQIPLPWSVLRYVPVLGPGAIAGPLRGPGDDGGRGALRAGARARRPQPSRSAAAMARGRRRAPGDRAGARAAHALLGGDSRALFDHRRGPAADVRVLELPVGVKDGTGSIGQVQPARAVRPDAARQGDHRRLSLARVAEAPAATPGARPS